jgi:hypothetical protein
MKNIYYHTALVLSSDAFQFTRRGSFIDIGCAPDCLFPECTRRLPLVPLYSSVMYITNKKAESMKSEGIVHQCICHPIDGFVDTGSFSQPNPTHWIVGCAPDCPSTTCHLRLPPNEPLLGCIAQPLIITETNWISPTLEHWATTSQKRTEPYLGLSNCVVTALCMDGQISRSSGLPLDGKLISEEIRKKKIMDHENRERARRKAPHADALEYALRVLNLPNMSTLNK